MKIHPFNISPIDIGEKVQRSSKKKKLPGTRNDESCRSGKWNAAALYSIVSPKFVSNKKEVTSPKLVEKAKTKKENTHTKKKKKEKREDRKEGEIGNAQQTHRSALNSRFIISRYTCELYIYMAKSTLHFNFELRFSS